MQHSPHLLTFGAICLLFGSLGAIRFHHAKTASFGQAAGFYYVPLMQFLGETTRESPGLALAFLLTVSALAYVVIQRRSTLWEPDFLALLIVLGFGVVVLASPSIIWTAFTPVLALGAARPCTASPRARGNPSHQPALAPPSGRFRSRRPSGNSRSGKRQVTGSEDLQALGNFQALRGLDHPLRLSRPI